MNIWLAMVLGGLITFGMRFSFVYLFGRFQIPETIRRALRYVPTAVLSAIIVPSLFIRSNGLDVELGNTYLLAGIVAIVVAWFTKSTLATIIAGLVTILLFQIF